MAPNWNAEPMKWWMYHPAERRDGSPPEVVFFDPRDCRRWVNLDRFS
ncbi:hypothetical protein HMPREF9579_02450 [Cutibacterium acnes HL087PA1]|nr:hypothetical protein HMPREF9616_02397 [Cutibacterium acnes HL007PA1]EGF65633.1 hypothetical protein HMPREF9579_02450 [Cutibacterium acnes HL087PA1]